MIPENATPSAFALVPPPSEEDAAARIVELMSNGFQEGIVGALFANADQLKGALSQCGFFVRDRKRPVAKNALSETRWIDITSKADGGEWSVLINSMGPQARVINCVLTGDPIGVGEIEE